MEFDASSLLSAPQNSRTSTGLYRKALAEAVEKTHPGVVVDFVEDFHGDPGLIVAFREHFAAALRQAKAVNRRGRSRHLYRAQRSRANHLRR